MIELPIAYVKLTPEEAKQLHLLMREKHGNVKACSELTGLTVFTLNRARNEMDLTPETAAIIRKKLLTTKRKTA